MRSVSAIATEGKVRDLRHPSASALPARPPVSRRRASHRPRSPCPQDRHSAPCCCWPRFRRAPAGLPPSTAERRGARREGEHQNLQVLPDTISHDALIAVMRNFTSSLGVRCTHCHVPYDPAKPDSLNFASDDKPTKDVARGMMRMVREINGDLLPDIPELGDNRMHGGMHDLPPRRPAPADAGGHAADGGAHAGRGFGGGGVPGAADAVLRPVHVTTLASGR